MIAYDTTPNKETRCCKNCIAFESKGEDDWSYCANPSCPCHTPDIKERKCCECECAEHHHNKCPNYLRHPDNSPCHTKPTDGAPKVGLMCLCKDPCDCQKRFESMNNEPDTGW